MGSLKKKVRGVSLIENMVALIIFLFGVVGWLSMESSLAQETGQSQVFTQAVFVGQSSVDVLRQMPMDQLVSSTVALSYDKSGYPVAFDSFYTVTWTVQDMPIGATEPEYKDVGIRVSWTFNSDANYSKVVELRFSRYQ